MDTNVSKRIQSNQTGRKRRDYKMKDYMFKVPQDIVFGMGS